MVLKNMSSGAGNFTFNNTPALPPVLTTAGAVVSVGVGKADNDTKLDVFATTGANTLDVFGNTTFGPNISFAVARTSRPEQPEALQGFHSDNLLFLIDEASN